MATATKAKDGYVCLLISVLWCDIFNLISGFAWLLLLGFSDPMLRFGGLALILVNLISVLFTCCGKYLTKGISSDCFWFRVFMLPVLGIIVIICLISGFSSRESYRAFPIITSIIGFIWFGISLMLLMLHSNKVKEERDVRQSQQVDLLNSSAPASVPVPPMASGDVEESIYENDSELFQKTQL